MKRYLLLLGLLIIPVILIDAQISQEENEQPTTTVTITEDSRNVIFESQDGTFIYEKSDCSISMMAQGDKTREIVGNYKIIVQELTRDGWENHPINDVQCITDVYHMENIMQADGERYLIEDSLYTVHYIITKNGIKIQALFQQDNNDRTSHYKFKEIIRGTFDSYDESRERITRGGISLEPTTEVRLLSRTNSIGSLSDIDNEYQTVDELPKGHAMILERTFGYS